MSWPTKVNLCWAHKKEEFNGEDLISYFLGWNKPLNLISVHHQRLGNQVIKVTLMLREATHTYHGAGGLLDLYRAEGGISLVFQRTSPNILMKG